MSKKLRAKTVGSEAVDRFGEVIESVEGRTHATDLDVIARSQLRQTDRHPFDRHELASSFPHQAFARQAPLALSMLLAGSL